MTEILFGIRVIKFYTWEPHFSQKVADCRKQELSHLKAIKYLDAMCVYTWAALPVVISILTFVTYVLMGHQLTAAKVGAGGGVFYARFVALASSKRAKQSWDDFGVTRRLISSPRRCSPRWPWWEC